MTKEEKKTMLMLRSLKFHILTTYYYEKYGNDVWHLLFRVLPRQLMYGHKVKELK